MSCTRLRFGLQTHLPAETKILFVLEYCRVRQWPALEAEAGLPQMACLVFYIPHHYAGNTQKTPHTLKQRICTVERIYILCVSLVTQDGIVKFEHVQLRCGH